MREERIRVISWRTGLKNWVGHSSGTPEAEPACLVATARGQGKGKDTIATHSQDARPILKQSPLHQVNCPHYGLVSKGHACI